MDTMPPQPLTTHDDLLALWSSLLESVPAHGRSLWLAFVDHDDRPHRALTQIDGLDLSPDAVAIGNLGGIVRAIIGDDGDVAGAILCLERAGTTGASPFEERWADALTAELGPTLRWPITVRTPGGVSRVPLGTRAA